MALLAARRLQDPANRAEEKAMAIVSKPKVRTKAVVDSRIMKMGTALSQDYIQSRKAMNDAVWNDRKSWFLCFYFGRGDDRLWAPRKHRRSQHPVARVINFAHPKGKQAAHVLMLCYLIGAIAAVLVGAMMIGYRW